MQEYDRPTKEIINIGLVASQVRRAVEVTGFREEYKHTMKKAFTGDVHYFYLGDICISAEISTWGFHKDNSAVDLNLVVRGDGANPTTIEYLERTRNEWDTSHYIVSEFFRRNLEKHHLFIETD